MDLTAEQIAVLAKIKEYGPGTPEAIAAFQEYERMRDAAKARAGADRRVQTLETKVRELGRKLANAER